MKTADHDELRPEYQRSDLGPGVRGKYYEQYQAGTNLVLLSPDVAAVFPDDASVNEALRALIKVAKRSASRTRPAGRRPATKAGN